MMNTETINEKQVLFFAPADDMKVFDDIAWSKKLSRSELLRRCVSETIAEHNQNK